MLEFDIWTIAFSIINILVLFLFLKKFLFGRIQNIMDQRAEQELLQKQEQYQNIEEVPVRTHSEYHGSACRSGTS